MTENLIHRLEAAEGPSRELDALIWAKKDGRDVLWENNRALAKSREAPFDECILGEYVEWAKGEVSFDCAAHKPPIPAYTASLDAAVCLVPEGWVPSLLSWAVPELSERNERVTAFVTLVTGDYKGHVRGDNGATPALALCIAALKAREAGDG